MSKPIEEFTEAEQKAIRSLERAIKKMPRSLVILTMDSRMHVHKAGAFKSLCHDGDSLEVQDKHLYDLPPVRCGAGGW